MSIISGTMHLSIMKGVAKIPQDAFSAETGIDEINLLDPGGFACDEYLMKIPAMKSSAVYADSPLTDGRTLISGALGNVTETIRLTLNSSTIIQLAAMLNKLGRFKQDCNDYWSTFDQIEPVYLKHQVDGEPGPRYALLYDIDIDIETPIDPSQPMRMVTLSIEREVGWRAHVRPGSTPQAWTLYALGQPITENNINLRDTNKYHTAFANVQSVQEFFTIFTFAKQNFIDIPASKLPGDLPPLVTMTMPIVTSQKYYISRVSKSLSLPDRKGNILPRFNSFAGAAGSNGIDATYVNDAVNGIVHPPLSANARRVDVSFATATDQIRLIWSASTTFGHLNPNLLRGRYRIFAIMRQVGGALGNISVYLKILSLTGLVENTQTVNPQVNALPVLHDLGSITIPFDEHPLVTSKGDGLSIASRYVSAGDLDANLKIELHALRTVAAGTLEFFNLIFMPYDEAMIAIDPQVSITRGSGDSLIYDNTGYFDHGKSQELGLLRLSDGASLGGDDTIPVELRGSFSLKPGVDNRLYFLRAASTGSGNENEVPPTGIIQVMINIIPRFSGLRDI